MKANDSYKEWKTRAKCLVHSIYC